MKYLKLYEYIRDLESLKYYIFDWDDNILHMCTVIHLERNIDGKWIDFDIETKDFPDIKNKYPENPLNNDEWKIKYNTFDEFGDNGPRGNKAFLYDTIKSIRDGKFGPSWKIFKKAIIDGKLFAIITTRSHNSETIKNVVRYIIEYVLNRVEREIMYDNLRYFNAVFRDKPVDLIEDYLDKCFFIGVTSNDFFYKFKFRPTKSAESLDMAKVHAINYFINNLRRYSTYLRLPLKVGYSDDDPSNISSVKNLFLSYEKNLEFIENFYVFDAKNKGNRIKI